MDSLPSGVHIYTAAAIAFPIIAALIYIFSKEEPDTGYLIFVSIDMELEEKFSRELDLEPLKIPLDHPMRELEKTMEYLTKLSKADDMGKEFLGMQIKAVHNYWFYAIRGARCVHGEPGIYAIDDINGVGGTDESCLSYLLERGENVKKLILKRYKNG